MSPVLSAALWIGGTVLLLAIAAVAASDQEDGAAFAGAMTASLVIPIGIAALIRWAVTRGKPHERAWSPWLVLIAAGIAVFFALPTLEEAGNDAKQAAECRDNTNPQGRFEYLPPGMTAKTLDAETQAQFNQLVSKLPDEAEVHIRQIVRDGDEPVGMGLVVTLGAGEGGRRDFIEGFTERAAERGATGPYEVNVGPATHGTQVNLSTPEGDGVIITGFAGCHAITAISAVEGDAKRIVSAMATAPER
jgi:hypothetical protein